MAIRIRLHRQNLDRFRGKEATEQMGYIASLASAQRFELNFQEGDLK